MDQQGHTIETLRENIVYQNDFVKFFDNDVRFPNGSQGKYVRYDWNAPYGVIIVPRLISGQYLLIKKFRYQEQRLFFEFPQGFGKFNSNPCEDALRELREEVGVVMHRVDFFTKFMNVFETFVFTADGIDMSSVDITSNDFSEPIHECVAFNIDDIALGTIGGVEIEHQTHYIALQIEKLAKSIVDSNIEP